MQLRPFGWSLLGGVRGRKAFLVRETDGDSSPPSRKGSSRRDQIKLSIHTSQKLSGLEVGMRKDLVKKSNMAIRGVNFML